MTKTNHPELYPEKWDQALVVAVGVVDDAINLLQGAPPLGHQLHRLLVPVMDPPLQSIITYRKKSPIISSNPSPNARATTPKKKKTPLGFAAFPIGGDEIETKKDGQIQAVPFDAQPHLRIQRVGELVGEPGMGGRRGGGGRHPPSRRREHRGRCPSPSSANPG